MKNTLIATMVVAFGLIGSVWAEEAGKSGKSNDKMDSAQHIQMHERMAEAHKNAAECLKSGKSEDVCRAEMKKAMEGIKKDCDCKDHGCSMDHHGKGKHQKHGEGK